MSNATNKTKKPVDAVEIQPADQTLVPTIERNLSQDKKAANDQSRQVLDKILAELSNKDQLIATLRSQIDALLSDRVAIMQRLTELSELVQTLSTLNSVATKESFESIKEAYNAYHTEYEKSLKQNQEAKK